LTSVDPWEALKTEAAPSLLMAVKHQLEQPNELLEKTPRREPPYKLLKINGLTKKDVKNEGASQ
jgi:hypothetical protein